MENKISLKNNEILEIKRPDENQNDGYDREVFDFFLSRGLVLLPKDIEKIKLKYEKIEGRQSFSAWAKDNPVSVNYPKVVVSLKDKFNFIAKSFPGLTGRINDIYSSAEIVDLKNGKDSEKTRELILLFLEEVLFDRLVGTPIIPPEEFFSNLENGKYGNLFGFDVKFVKEVNDNVSYVDGDMMIKTLWDKIRLTLGDQVDKFDIQRRGSTFIFALKKGEIVENSIVNELRQITSLMVEVGSEMIDLPLGIGEIVPSSSLPDINRKKQVRDSYEKLLNNLDSDFYSKLAMIFNQDTNFNESIYKLWQLVFPQKANFENNMFIYDIPLLAKLSRYLFIGKRARERSGNMLATIQSRGEFSQEEFNPLRMIMEKISKYSYGKTLTLGELNVLFQIACGVVNFDS
ncbi:MAG: hypothetical protein UR68_C0006G0026 [Candidatus Roizmanbacteria bacterium GW2011_GWA2_35_19]|uniref:Uncharacterized protein n=2 Tax=Candidatus Roizmaniibacteriota TaxID=1752723 RepID=A0A0G0BV28_9BACT|nr:MAG: hypothetical protein UR63_C0045G0004 [Candidatus Roizmanbacteria bacterium GW2011_GWC2_35_12]KKP73209.1 MAG: hypothetical protein UR68_C0006G0026 [Candidatus Roizmanbacteria bacterium GW2011_GWA2_35_19]